MRNNRKWLVTVVLAALLVCIACTACGAAEYRTLQQGDEGRDVQELKIAMYYLGYFTTSNVSDQYNGVMVERVKMLQANNGLEETGIATPELQALVFSGNAVPTDNAPKPTATPIPVAYPQAAPADMPPLTEEHFLSADAGMDEYVYVNADEGQWIYISPSVNIEVKRYDDVQHRNTWFEAEIYCSPESPLFTRVNRNANGKITGKLPRVLAKEHSMVLAISDDQFGDRLSGGGTPGIIIREGEVLYTKTYASNKKNFPNLDILAVFSDGSMKTFLSGDHTAQEYIDMGAMQVFSFGPILVQSGALGDKMLLTNYYHYQEPRMALGMIEPYHYIVLAANGRVQGTYKGVYLTWLADRMIELGVQEAINLDGGGTTALMFMGEKLTKNGSSDRRLYSIIGFGTSELVPEP